MGKSWSPERRAAMAAHRRQAQKLDSERRAAERQKSQMDAIIAIRLSGPEREAMGALRKAFSLGSDSELVRHALRSLASHQKVPFPEDQRVRRPGVRTTCTRCRRERLSDHEILEGKTLCAHCSGTRCSRADCRRLLSKAEIARERDSVGLSKALCTTCRSNPRVVPLSDINCVRCERRLTRGENIERLAEGRAPVCRRCSRRFPTG
jgi:hypothetical protein